MNNCTAHKLFHCRDRQTIPMTIAQGFKSLIILAAWLINCTASGQELLINGGSHTGAINSGGTQTWSFNASMGDSVFLRVSHSGSGSVFSPRFGIYDAEGLMVGFAESSKTSTASSARLDFIPPSSGTFNLVVDSNIPNGSGSYRIDFMVVPGDPIIAPNETGGPLTNGGRHEGTISLGDLDSWNFDVFGKEYVELRMAQISGTDNFVPRLRVFNSKGEIIAENSGSSASTMSEARIAFISDAADTLTVVADSATSEGTGNYRIHYLNLAQAYTVPPNDDGATLISGERQDGATSLSDIDPWNFEAMAGDTIFLHVAQVSGTTGYSPRLRIFNSLGGIVGHAKNDRTTELSESRLEFILPESGTYTVLIDSSTPENTGSYRMFYFRVHSQNTTQGNSGAPLVSNNNDGGTTLGELDLWNFNGKMGNRITLKLDQLSGGAGYSPRARVFDPNGELIGFAQDPVPSANSSAVLSLILAAEGTFTVVVDSGLISGAGTYRLNYLNEEGPFNYPAPMGATLASGQNYEDGLLSGEEDWWSFEAEAGNHILLRAARLTGNTSWFRPTIYLYGPDGELLASGDSSNHDNLISLVAPISGTFQVKVQPQFVNYDGTYRLHYLKFPGGFTTPGGDEGGSLVPGANHEGTITTGDMDAWTFEAQAGQQVLLRNARLTGNTAWFRPRILLFGPDGSLLDAGDSADHDNLIHLTTPLAGTYTVLVWSHFADYDGTYRLHYLKIPGGINTTGGDEGGALTNGGNHEGAITMGDMDAWTFEAGAGQQVLLRSARLTGNTSWFRPRILLFGPDGNMLGEGDPAEHDNLIHLTTPIAGTYFAVIWSHFAGYDGTYRLHFLNLPGGFSVPGGDNGGSLTNGGNHEGAITMGDMDAWTFEAEAGQQVLLRNARLTGNTSWFRPRIMLFGPDGRVLDEGNPAEHDNWINLITPSAGTYTALAWSHFAGYDGTYRLHYLKLPGGFAVPGGDEGGILTNGGRHEGSITMGDMDAWTFDAADGEHVLLRAARLTGNTSWFRPRLLLYGPHGNLLAEGDPGHHDNIIDLKLPESGKFTAVVWSHFAGYDGTYVLYQVKTPGQFSAPGGDEGGKIIPETLHDGVLTLADMDVWSFAANAGNRITINAQEMAGGSSFSPRIQVYGPEGQLINSVFHASLAQLNFTAPDSGLFMVVISNNILGGNGSYQISTSGLPSQDKLIRYVRHLDNRVTINVPSSTLREGWVLQHNDTLNKTTWQNVSVFVDNGLNIRVLIPQEVNSQFFRIIPPQPE
ncbi:MAG: hypothetical protein LR011_08510 [Verrucomicrobia bacterium]|nr:hypothetical protein [Verrucomicrobiota bacterium]